MKRFRILLLLAAIFMLLLPQSGAQAAPGSLLHASNLYLSGAAQLSQGVYWNSALNDRITENYIEYTPNDTVVPIIAYGNYIYGGNPLARLTEILAGRGQRVVAAINADYFNMSTRVPLSTVIENGILKSSENEDGDWSSSIGFYADGRACIGRLNLYLQLTTDSGGEYPIIRFNKALAAKGQNIQLFSADYATNTRADIPSLYAVLRLSEGYLGLNSTVTAYVERAGSAAGPIDIAPGYLVLALSQDSENETAKAALAALSPGRQVSISIRGDTAWEDVIYAVGAGEKLLTNGQVVAPEFSAGSKESLMPRSAFGLRPDGSYIFYTVDGRQKGYSAGTTLAEVAQRLRELGCLEAVNLDGGGSTTLSAAYPGQEGLKTVNRPSEGSLRTCANYILLINRGNPNGPARQLHLYPYDSLVLAGASLDLSLAASNADHLPAALPDDSVEYSVDNKTLGTVDENGRFTAGRQAASGYVYAESGGLSGRARITVVDKADSVTIMYAASGKEVGKQLTLYGGGSVQLGMAAIYNHMYVTADAASFNWSLSGDIGTIDASGLLTARADEGEGMLTASLGALSVSVAVRVSNKAALLEDFESFTTREDAGGAWRLSQNTDKALVRFGKASGKLDYDFGAAAEGQKISVPLEFKLADEPNHLNFWLYGDASHNQLMLTVGQGEEQTVLPVALLDFAGWQYISLPLPPGATGLISLYIQQNGKESGSLYVDQLMCAHGRYTDNEPPQIELWIDDEDGALFATVADAMDKDIKAANISLTCDGLPVNFNFDAASGKLIAIFPESKGKAQRLTVMARDKSGNIARSSLDLAATEEQPQPFIDMKGHWAEGYTTYLHQQGIINGMEGPKGLSYAPNTNMNRAQFAVIMCNWLKVDAAQYEETELPFADINSIGGWAYPAIQAMYALGVTKGSAVNDKLYYNPASPISRAEAMTMIGRTLERGYSEAVLDFVDSASVAEWAAPYVRTLVALQVVGGMDGNKLAPGAYVTRAQVAKMLYSLM